MSNMIKPGDILIFKAGDDWVGKSIAWLTRTDVSHAAMAYKPGTIVEMGAKGIRESRITETQGDDAYVLRLDPERDPEPLLKAAELYINAETRYDFPALVILAGLLIYRSIRPTPKLAVITDTILRAACKLLDELIQKIILKNPSKAMVCSQLVYQVYRDCGDSYRIQIEGGNYQVTNALDKASVGGIEDGLICLADMLAAGEFASSNMALAAESLDGIEENPEELARRLYVAMEESAVPYNQDAAAINLGQITQMAQKFIGLIEKFLETSGIDIPIDALFVTPGDMLYHAKNLRREGVVTITRL